MLNRWLVPSITLLALAGACGRNASPAGDSSSEATDTCLECTVADDSTDGEGSADGACAGLACDSGSGGGIRWSWDASGFAPWKADLHWNRLSVHSGEVLLARSDAGEIAMQATCTESCRLVVACRGEGQAESNAQPFVLPTYSVNGLRSFTVGNYVATGQLADDQAESKFDGYWRGRFDHATCKPEIESYPLPAASWFLDVQPIDDGSDIVLVGRDDPLRDGPWETPWVFRRGGMTSAEIRAGPVQGEGGVHYRTRSARILTSKQGHAVLSKLQWVGNGLNEYGLWSAHFDADLDLIRMGSLDGSTGAGSVEGATLLDTGELLVYWRPNETFDIQKSRWLASYDKTGALQWKKSFPNQYALTWQPMIPRPDGTLAFVAFEPTQPIMRRFWTTLHPSDDSSTEGPEVPLDALPTGMGLSDGVVVAWLDGQTLHVERHAWPMTW